MISHNEAQELHRLIGGALQSAEDNQWELIGADDLTRALELAALLVSDTSQPDTSITVYLIGDEDAPNLFGIIYDEEDEAMEVARENDGIAWRVPAQLYGDQAVRLESDSDE
jgi:hypothetical protein